MPSNFTAYTDDNSSNVRIWSNIATGWRTSDYANFNAYIRSADISTIESLASNTVQASQPVSENEWPPEKDGDFKEEEIELIEKRMEIKANILRHQIRCKNKKKRKS